MRMWVLVRSVRACEEVAQLPPLVCIGFWIAERAILVVEGSSDHRSAIIIVRIVGSIAYSDLHGLHCLENCHVELSAHERRPDFISDPCVKRLLGQPAGKSEGLEVGFALKLLSTPTEAAPAGRTVSACCRDDEPLCL